MGQQVEGDNAIPVLVLTFQSLLCPHLSLFTAAAFSTLPLFFNTGSSVFPVPKAGQEVARWSRSHHALYSEAL
ncbi:hypothetical protein BT69DRAFT_1285593, partial [Atractiella rhizophila]